MQIHMGHQPVRSIPVVKRRHDLNQTCFFGFMLRRKPNPNSIRNGLLLDALIGTAKYNSISRDVVLKPALKVELSLGAIIGNKEMIGERVN